jgi:dTDP-4-amino-4,6-dideoxygalactose transaminase
MGAIPVFSDCDPETYQPDAASIESRISPRTRAIVIVHFGGYPADMDRIVKVAKKHRLPLIEDCAHAQGTQWRGKGAGTFGDFGTFSFQQSKAFTSGEGGLLICKNKELWSNAYRYHNLGRMEDAGFYDFRLPSSNFRMTDLQGAMLLAQFARFKKQITKKNANDKYLTGLFRKIGGVEPLPDDPRVTRRGNYYWIFKYKAAEFGGLPREEFLKALQAEGVGASRSYGRPIYKYPLFQDMKVPAKYKNAQYKKTRCPVADRIFAGELCTLSHFSLLAERDKLAKVAEAIVKIKENVGELLKKQKK